VAIQIALLRGVNVGGNRKVAMADLRAAVTEMGFTDVQSLLQSGNLVFRASGRAGAATLERTLEQGVEERLGVRTDFHVRTVAEWEAAIAANPFPAEARRDPGHLLVLFMKGAPAPKAVQALQAAITGPERVRAEGRQAYLVYPDGAGRSRVTNAVLDKHLGGRGTARNWNTVLKLAELVKLE
jgi:uncharacterized protein (DUF1697 family)